MYNGLKEQSDQDLHFCHSVWIFGCIIALSNQTAPVSGQLLLYSAPDKKG